MAREIKDPLNLQVFRGSLPRADVFSANAGVGCCPTTQVQYDKLGARVRFDNALAHSNPTGANDKWMFRHGTQAGDTSLILDHLNDNGVGASVSVLVIPTFAFVKGIGIKIQAMEEGVTFNLKTRNGLDIEAGEFLVVDTGHDGSCISTHVLSTGTFEGFGELPEDVVVRDIFFIPNETPLGNFSLEADELILELASVPAEGIIKGEFLIDVAVSYEIINRAIY